MGEVISTSITQKTDSGKVTEVLKLTQEEFEKIAAVHGVGKRYEQRSVCYSEALKKAQAAVRQGEELKEENFGRVDTDGFEKAVILMKYWAEMTMNEMLKERNIRIEINYNAEERKTDFAIYTPAEKGQANSQPEHSDS